MKLPRLLQLAMDNINAPKGIRAEVEGDETTVYLNGVIGGFWGDVSAVEFAKTFAGIKSDTVHLRINSPGGDVFEARAIMTTVAQHKAKVIGHIDGIAASAATDVCMACDELEISRGARFMIHNAWTLTMGDKRDHEQVRQLLDNIDADIAADYQKRTGADTEQVVAWMNDETWFSADESVEHGFVDRVVEVVKGGSAADNRWNLSAYKNAPEDLQKPAAPEPPKYDFAAMQRRLALLEKVAA